jgi:hypothetical protein
MTTFRFLSAALLAICFFLFQGKAQAQNSPDTTHSAVIQFSGLIVDADSLVGVPFSAVVIKSKNRGVYSTYSGYFTIACEPRDTVEFFSLGYKHAYFIIPDTITTATYNHVQALKADTLLLHAAVIYPWPTKEEFKEAFLALNVPDDDLRRAERNLEQQQMALLAQNIGQDGKMAYSTTMRQQVAKNYYAGQYAPNNLLNPIAWSKFIQSLGK